MERQSRVEADDPRVHEGAGLRLRPGGPVRAAAALTGASRLSDEEFLKQFGYGISTLWGRGNAQTDPNERLRTSLGPADRRAYDRALWGDNPGATFQAAVDSGDFTEARRLHPQGDARASSAAPRS